MENTFRVLYGGTFSIPYWVIAVIAVGAVAALILWGRRNKRRD